MSVYKITIRENDKVTGESKVISTDIKSCASAKRAVAYADSRAADYQKVNDTIGFNKVYTSVIMFMAKSIESHRNNKKSPSQRCQSIW